MRVIYIDDERPNLENFKFTTKDFSEIKSLNMFQSGEEALEFAKQEGAAIAEEHVREQGAAGKIAVTYDIERNEAKIDLGSTMWIADTLTVTATGNPGL